MSSFIDIGAWLWLGLLALGFLLLRRRARLAGLSLLLLGFAWWVLERTGLPARLLAGLEEPYLGRSATVMPPPADAIVVLGGWGVASTNEWLGLDFGPAADRLLTGIHLARQRLAPVLVVGGAATTSGEEGPEPELVRRWLSEWGLLEQPVLGLGPCRTTRDEALRVAVLAEEQGWSRVLLVTSTWHMKRAEAAFAAAGVNVVPVGADSLGTSLTRRRTQWVPQASSLYILQLWIHEVIGFHYYRARGWAGRPAEDGSLIANRGLMDHPFCMSSFIR
jgi:uncharacterized SAM-binding protein YcdF (DUF218 family)